MISDDVYTFLAISGFVWKNSKRSFPKLKVPAPQPIQQWQYLEASNTPSCSYRNVYMNTYTNMGLWKKQVFCDGSFPPHLSVHVLMRLSLSDSMSWWRRELLRDFKVTKDGTFLIGGWGDGFGITSSQYSLLQRPKLNVHKVGGFDAWPWNGCLWLVMDVKWIYVASTVMFDDVWWFLRGVAVIVLGLIIGFWCLDVALEVLHQGFQDRVS